MLPAAAAAKDGKAAPASVTFSMVSKKGYGAAMKHWTITWIAAVSVMQVCLCCQTGTMGSC
jgi:hypothetical protein